MEGHNLRLTHVGSGLLTFEQPQISLRHVPGLFYQQPQDWVTFFRTLPRPEQAESRSKPDRTSEKQRCMYVWRPPSIGSVHSTCFLQILSVPVAFFYALKLQKPSGSWMTLESCLLPLYFVIKPAMRLEM